MKMNRVFKLRGLVALIAVLASVMAAQQGALAQVFSRGDVFVAVGNGSVQWRHGDGTFVNTLTVPFSALGKSNLFTTGMAFDPSTNLYVTLFDSQAVARFNNRGVFIGLFGSGYAAEPESICFDAQTNAYVGQASFNDAPNNGAPNSTPILKFDSLGNAAGKFFADRESRGTDWVDLGADQCTLYYTSEGTHVKVFNVCTGTQLPDFNSTPLVGAAAYAHRLLANGDTLVADSSQIARLDDTGTLIQTYTVTNEGNFFALNLDPDGTNFWSADLVSGDVYKFNIDSGHILTHFNAGGTVNGLTNSVGGLVVMGEITAATTPASGQCITRNARFWFTHAFSPDPNCVTLLRALQANIGGVSLGFLRLPVSYETANNFKGANDALVEALGFYYRSTGYTGESSGTQSEKLNGSKLCRQRKLLAVELIAATANVRLLGTDPADCSYKIGKVTTNFPANLLQQAEQIELGVDPVACASMTLLLRKFNQGGVAANFLTNGPVMAECSPTNAAVLRTISRDPTTEISCPGLNTSCNTAEAIAFSNPTGNPFAPARYAESIGLQNFISNPLTNFSTGTQTNIGISFVCSTPNGGSITICDAFTNTIITTTIITNITHVLPTPTCGPFSTNSVSGGGGFSTAGAMWVITPDLGQAGRQFTVNTIGSNLQTVLSVWSGTCDGLNEIDCETLNLPYINQSQSVFTTDGINNFYILAESADGSVGQLQLHVTSP